MQIYKVGGCVRDLILNRKCHDVDYVVVGSTPEEMIDIGYKQVGNDFPVFLHPQTGEEYALARKEVSTGDKYTDFKFQFTPDITLREDLERRDFTMNALAQDMHTGCIEDYFNGQKDIQDKIIRHVNAEHFIEDPLRVLRAIRFACQLNFTIAPETEELCTNMVNKGMLRALTPERVWKEMEKALSTPAFDVFLMYLDKFGALQEILPEVYALKEVPERLEYHPEGNSYKHLILVHQALYNRYASANILDLQNPHELAILNFGILCHDLGKSKTQECWPSHHNHEILGIELVETLCDTLKVPNEFRNFGKLACNHHMKFYKFLDMNVKNQYDFIKQITKFKGFDKMSLLLTLHSCDLLGRDGTIAHQRIETYYNVCDRIKTIYNILEDIGMEDLPIETQQNLARFKGEQFGKLYRDAMISYLKHNLQKLK